jgi:hypothetical protein
MTSTLLSTEAWITVRTWVPNCGPNFAGMASWVTHASAECPEIKRSKGKVDRKAGIVSGALCLTCFGGKAIKLQKKTSIAGLFEGHGSIEIRPVATGFDGEITGIDFAVLGSIPKVANGSKRFSDLDEAKAFANEVFRLAREAGWVLR